MTGEVRGGDGSDLDGMFVDAQLAPPMANGEVLFDAPWQGRVFGMARVLAEAGCFTWDDFRAHLIAQIGAWDRSAGGDLPPGEAAADYRYYDHFLAALQAVLAEKGLLAPTALEDRVNLFADRPHGHDHDHDH